MSKKRKTGTGPYNTPRTPQRGEGGGYSILRDQYWNREVNKLSEEIAELYKTINEKNTENYTMNYKITTFEKTIKKQNTIIADQNEKLKDQLSIYKFMYQEVIQKDAEITRKDAEITRKDATLKILHSQLDQQFTELNKLHVDLRYARNLNEQLSKQLGNYLETSPSASRKHNGITRSPLTYRI
jgi:peptidoglycan hydrolase CwlO-like protein